MDDDSLHSLLARGRLSGAQRERALEGALRQARRRNPWYWAVLGGGFVVPAAAAIALLIRMAPTPSAATVTRTMGSGLVAKGAGGLVLHASCPGRRAFECHVGDRLVFEIEGAKQPGFFAAWAECAGAERIWYFPTASGMLPAIDEPRTVVNQAVRIGPEHGVGTCALHLLALDQRESRATLLAGGTNALSRADLAIEVKP